MSKGFKQYSGKLQNRIANQRAEIERLHAVIEELTIKYNDLRKHALGIIRALTAENEAQAETITNLIGTIKDIQADTVRKMWERIAERSALSCETNGLCVTMHTVDQIAKDMLGEKTDGT